MDHPMTKKELLQCWVAFILTAGEFTVAILLLVHEGHLLALYLAITYASRETTGGKHYHNLVGQVIHRAWRKRQ